MIDQTIVLLMLLSVSPLFLSPSNALETNVELVQILFRHGDRTPIMSYPTDPYTEATWEKFGGFGQLTQAGMDRLFEYGGWLAKRYEGFLSKTYNKNRVFVRSTNFDRTLMSAYSLLAGLYEPSSFQVWNKDLKWQPIPVHTTEAAYDNVFFSNPCPRLDQLREEVRNTDEFKNKNSELSELLKVLDQNGGYNNSDLFTISALADVLFIEKSNDLPLPSWAEEYYESIVKNNGLSPYFGYRNPEMAKLTSGGILWEMRNNMLIKTNTTNTTAQELILFSGHDHFVAALTKLLDITPCINQPPYASSITLELRRTLSDNPSYFVQVYLKNNTASEPISYRSMTINGCEELCPLDKFLKITENLVVDNISAACKSNIKLDNSLFTKLFLVAIFGFTLIVLVLVVIASIQTLQQLRRNPVAFRLQSMRNYEVVNLVVGDDDDLDDVSADRSRP